MHVYTYEVNIPVDLSCLVLKKRWIKYQRKLGKILRNIKQAVKLDKKYMNKLKGNYFK